MVFQESLTHQRRRTHVSQKTRSYPTSLKQQKLCTIYFKVIQFHAQKLTPGIYSCKFLVPIICFNWLALSVKMFHCYDKLFQIVMSYLLQILGLFFSTGQFCLTIGRNNFQNHFIFVHLQDFSIPFPFLCLMIFEGFFFMNHYSFLKEPLLNISLFVLILSILKLP